MGQCRPFDCRDQGERSLTANPDIAGIGVVIGFMGNAYLAYLLLILFYLVSYDCTKSTDVRRSHDVERRSLSTYRSDRTAMQDGLDNNQIDGMFLRWVRGVMSTVMHRFGLQRYADEVTCPSLRDSLTALIINMADLQLLTGLCILITGFANLNCGISAYHWRILVDLAWFSSVTHLSGLIAVRSSIVRRHWEVYLRMGLALVYLIMLMLATVPVSFFDWADPMIGWRNRTATVQPGSPAACYFNLHLASEVHDQLWDEWCEEAVCIYDQPPFWIPPPTPMLSFNMYYRIIDTPTFQGTIFSLILLIVGFVFRFIKIIPPPARLTMAVSKTPPIRLAARWINTVCQSANRLAPFENLADVAGYALFWQPLFAALIVVQFHIDLIFSLLGEFSWLLLLLVWSTYRVMGARNAIGDVDVEVEENEWTFGQTLPVLLLVGPVLFIARSVATHKPPNEAYAQGIGTLTASSTGPTCSSGTSTKKRAVPQHHDVVSPPTTPRSPIRAWGTSSRSDIDSTVAGEKYYAGRFWAGFSILTAWVSLCLLAATFLETIIDRTGGGKHVPLRPIIRFLAHDFKPLPYLFLHHPMTCHLNVLAGMCLERVAWLAVRHKLRRIVHGIICMAILSTYATWTLYVPLYSRTRAYEVLGDIPAKSMVIGGIISLSLYTAYVAVASSLGWGRMDRDPRNGMYINS